MRDRKFATFRPAVTCLIILVLLLAGRPVLADWHPSDPCKGLPGITCGKDLAKDLAITFGGAAAAALVYNKFFAHRHKGVEVSAAQIDFGKVPIPGHESRAPLLVSNTSNGDMTINVLSLLGAPAYSVTNAAEFPIVLKPAESRNFEIRFDPGLVKKFEASLEIRGRGSDGTQFNKKVKLRGNGVSDVSAVVSSPVSKAAGSRTAGVFLFTVGGLTLLTTVLGL